MITRRRRRLLGRFDWWTDGGHISHCHIVAVGELPIGGLLAETAVNGTVGSSGRRSWMNDVHSLFLERSPKTFDSTWRGLSAGFGVAVRGVGVVGVAENFFRNSES